MPEVDSLVPQNKAESTAKLDSLTDTVVKPSATLRNWNDIPVTRDSIYSSALRGVNDRFASLENNTHKFVLKNARYDEKLPTLKDEHEAILARRTLSRKMYGDLDLVDKATGETVSSRSGLVLAHVPHYTNRGTFIRGGSEYMVFNQQRLKPGVYTRVKKSGDFEAQFNVLPGTGRGFRLQMDPATGVFKFQVGQGTVKAYPVMKALGIDDETLKTTWGSDLWSKNVAQKTGRGEDTFKFAKGLGTSYDGVTDQNFAEVLPNILGRMKLDTRVTSRTLGKPYETISAAALLDSSKKLLAVARGEADPDERDSVDFQSFHSVEDFMYDHMKNDSDKAARKALWKSTFNKDLAKIPTGMLDANLDSIFMASRLGSMITQVNPLEVLDLRHKISRMGEGGVGDMRAISREARGLQPSHFGLIDPLRAPESLRIGLDSRLAYRTFKGSDNNIYSEVKDVNTGEIKTVPSSVMVDSVVAFPGEMNSKKKYISAMKNGSMQLVEKKEVQYELPHAEDTFSPLTNMIPLMAHAKGQRMLMGSRMATQALSLVNPEARSVQAKDSRTGRSFDEVYGSDLGAVFADGEGTVSKVTPEAITIKNEDGTEKTHELYNNFPFNTKGFLHNTPIVKEGTKVGPGMILAKSNFTDASGRAAYGKNLRVAFHPYNIYTHDDGIVISESAAKKMSSEMMFKEKLAKDDFVDDVNKNRFISLFPGKLKKEQLDNIDDDGIIKLGSTVNPGDPLLLAIGKTKPSAAGAIMRQKKSMFTDNAITWDHDYPAIITDARKAKDGWQITLKSAVPVREGDKLANSFGGKGVVSKIIPDEKMLKDAQGNLLDIVVSPAGLVSRVNPAQIIESQLAKITAKTGIPYVLPGFNQEQDLHDFMMKELAKHKLADTEDIYDPEIDKTLPKVLTGSMYFMRLMHTADGKMSGRGLGQYSSDFAPAKGGDDEQQAKRFGNLDLNALVSYGATEVLKDRIIRGQQNDEYWKMYRLGYTPPKPTVFEPYQRFINYVKGSGAQIKDDGNFLHLMPFTDKAIEEMGGHEIKSGESYDFNSMEPISGGLFDVATTGGKDGNKWSYIQLHKPIPNPAIEAPIASLLEISPAKLKQVLEGEESIGSLTGPDAVQYALSKVNVKEGIEREKYNISTKKRDQRDKAVKRLRLLTMMGNYNMQPSDLMISKIPVLPPKYRPIAMMNGTQLISDPNYLYKEVFEANDNMKQTETKLGQKESLKDLGVVYSAVKAVFGMGDPVTVKNQEKNVRGLLRDFVGKGSPKGGSWQRRVLGGTVDTVGRGVIIPDPTLPMDFVSLPDEMAWKMFEPFVMRSLVRGGMPAVAAKDAITNRTGMAEKALDSIMNQRPIMMNRAPTLHKHNFTAHWAQRHKGSAIKVPLATLPGWGADFDGDAMNVHVPVGDDAVKDAVEKMMPSRNLFSAKNMSVHMKPEQMALLGLYKATAPATADKKPVRFKSRADVILAYNRGEIGPNDPVVIEE